MPGKDWTCNDCGFKNFARRNTCFHCVEEQQDHDHSDHQEDTWHCDNCGGDHRSDTFLQCPHALVGSIGGGAPQQPQQGPQQSTKRAWATSGWVDYSPKVSKGNNKAGNWQSGGGQFQFQGGQFQQQGRGYQQQQGWASSRLMHHQSRK